MPAIDLIFTRLPLTAHPIALVFGETEALAVPPATAQIAGTLPPLTLASRARDVRRVQIAGTLPGLVFMADVRYASNTARPTVGQMQNNWQAAQQLPSVGIASGFQAVNPLPASVDSRWARAVDVAAQVAAGHAQAVRTDTAMTAHFDNALRLPAAQFVARHQEAYRSIRATLTSLFDSAKRLDGDAVRMWHQEAYRDRQSSSTSAWQNANQRVQWQITSKAGRALNISLAIASAYQNAMRPPPGRYTPPVVQPVNLCYTPSGVLVFDLPAPAPLALVFICERFIAPIKEPFTIPTLAVYMLINNVSLKRVDNGAIINALSFSLALDVDSWTWTFSAEIQASYLAAVQRTAPEAPVELEANVNGFLVRVLAEELKRNRVFGDTTLQLGGRGINAVLDNPYSPIMNFGNTGLRTMQQLALDALTVNGVSNGWNVDWKPVDWAVPGDVWKHRGTYASAINALAVAAGAYAQPHPVLKTLKILRRYPVLPWEWATVVPDYVLPANAVTVEATAWLHKPRYTRVFVNGEKSGVSVQVTRAGQAGAMLAPQIVDSLITTVEGARARGEAILSDTGNQVRRRLRLPVFPEMGLILPGNFVQYTEGGASALGIVRALAVEAAPLESWQTLEVESYA